MKKDLDYYMNLPYSMKISPIPDSEGGGYEARIPDLGEFAVVGDGDTPEEAISNLEKVKKERLEAYLKEGIKIPEPEKQSDFSGRFVLRVGQRLHMLLSIAAKERKLSLNQYIKSLLEQHISNTEIESKIKALGDELVKHYDEVLQKLAIRIESLEENYSPSSIGLPTTFLTASGSKYKAKAYGEISLPNLDTAALYTAQNCITQNSDWIYFDTSNEEQ